MRTSSSDKDGCGGENIEGGSLSGHWIEARREGVAVLVVEDVVVCVVGWLIEEAVGREGFGAWGLLGDFKVAVWSVSFEEGFVRAESGGGLSDAAFCSFFCLAIFIRLSKSGLLFCAHALPSKSLLGIVPGAGGPPFVACDP